MVNTCCIDGCKRGWVDGKFRGFTFPTKKRPEITTKWKEFVGKKNWTPTDHSTICYKHFDTKFYNRGKRWTLLWKLGPVPTLYPPVLENSLKRKSFLVAEKSILKKVKHLKFDELNLEHAPSGFYFRRQENHLIYYNLEFDDITGFPSIRECIKINRELHVELQFKGSPMPLPNWFRQGTSATLTKYTEIVDFVKYIEETAVDYKSKMWLLEELKERIFYKSTKPYSSTMIRFALEVRYTSLQAYRYLIEMLPFPSVSLLSKIQQGGVDSLKALKRLREAGDISPDIILMLDEMFLRKCTQYQNGKYIGEDENGELYKGIVLFLVEGLQKSVQYVVQAIPEVKLTGEWLSQKVSSCLTLLGEAGFVTRAVCADNHSTNVNAYKRINTEYNRGENDYGILHASNNGKKTYLLYDPVHLLKNIRNNLLAAKKFVFPAFEFKMNEISVSCPSGYITWGDLHRIYDRDLEQQANLKKAPKLTYQSLHPGNNKQNVPLALSIFHETTIVAVESYFPERKDISGFLSIINAWWKISNCKERFDPNPLGNAVMLGDGKVEFLLYFASWIQRWSESPYYTLTTNTSKALTTTLVAQCRLINELLSEGYMFVMTGRLQSDPVERRFSRYRSMNGGCFLVSLREVLNSERILACRSLLKEGIDFWKDDEDLCPNTALETPNESLAIAEIRNQSVDILECDLTNSSSEVATTIAGYVSKKLKKRSLCESCLQLLRSNKIDLDNNHYLNILSRGGLTVPSSQLAELTCSCFAILDFIAPTLRRYNVVNVKRVASMILAEFAPKRKIICSTHENWGRQFCFKVIINIFFNNKQKESLDTVRKDSLKAFKKRQLTKE